jgi:hypothetical protein
MIVVMMSAFASPASVERSPRGRAPTPERCSAQAGSGDLKSPLYYEFCIKFGSKVAICRAYAGAAAEQGIIGTLMCTLSHPHYSIESRIKEA